MGAIVTRTNVAYANVSVAVVPCSYFCVPNFIAIVPFLLLKNRWGFFFLFWLLLLLFAKAKSTPSRRPKTGVWQFAWNILMIFLRYDGYMPEKHHRNAWKVTDICLIFTRYMPYICLRNTLDMPKIYPTYIQDKLDIYLIHIWDILKIYPRYA